LQIERIQWWLAKVGHEMLLVERAPALRTGSRVQVAFEHAPPRASTCFRAPCGLRIKKGCFNNAPVWQRFL
jgi:hypothetical protein